MTLTKDMTSGKESEHIIKFTLPLLLGNLLQQTYNIADTIIVGRYLGDDALAAVGATGSITFLFYTLCIGLSVGAGIIISQFFGAGLLKRVKAAVVNSALVTAVFGFAISIVSVFMARDVLTLLGVPEKLIDTSAEYMRIACGGTVLAAAYNWINSVMRALGDSKTPLIFLGVATVLNVGLDLLFVVGLKAGAGGAAIATVLAQGLSAFSCIIYCFKNNADIRPSREEIKPDPQLITGCIKTGVPIAAQNGLVSISMVALQCVTNSFGEAVMAAYTVTMRIENFIHQPFSSMNAAISTFTGQNIGAGKHERAVNGLSFGLKTASVFSIAITALFIAFGKYIVGFFVSGDEVITIGAGALVITSLFYIPLGAIYVTRGFLNGAGDTGYALANGLCEVICRIVFSLILTRIPAIGFWGIWITTAVTWTATGVFSLLRYKGGRWKNKAIIKE